MNLKEFADTHGVKVPTLYTYIKRHEEEFKGHILKSDKDQRESELDQYAHEILERKYGSTDGIVIYKDNPETLAELERVKANNEELAHALSLSVKAKERVDSALLELAELKDNKKIYIDNDNIEGYTAATSKELFLSDMITRYENIIAEHKNKKYIPEEDLNRILSDIEAAYNEEANRMMIDIFTDYEPIIKKVIESEIILEKYNSLYKFIKYKLKGINGIETDMKTPSIITELLKTTREEAIKKQAEAKNYLENTIPFSHDTTTEREIKDQTQKELKQFYNLLY